MAFRLIRQRREQRRVAKLEEIFQAEQTLNIKYKLNTTYLDNPATGSGQGSDGADFN